MIELRLTPVQAIDLLSWVELAADSDEIDLDDVEQRLIDEIYGKNWLGDKISKER